MSLQICKMLCLSRVPTEIIQEILHSDEFSACASGDFEAAKESLRGKLRELKAPVGLWATDEALRSFVQGLTSAVVSDEIPSHGN